MNNRQSFLYCFGKLESLSGRAMRWSITLLSVVCILLSQNTVAQNACDAYYDDALGSPRSVIPRYNDDGTIKGFFVYDEAAFRRDTPSLHAAARRRAEAGVREVWSGFVLTNIDAQALFNDSIREEVTSTGVSEEVLINELNEQIITIKENTNATVSGFVKADECIDRERMVVSVMYAWKPGYSQMGADASREMKRALNEDSGTFSRQDQEQADSNAVKSESRRTKSDIDF